MIPRNTVRRITEAPTIQYNNGKNEVRMTAGVGRFTPGAPGFYTEIGKDADLDAWLEAVGCAQMEIRHPRTGGPAQVVRHWNLGEQVRIYPVTSGPVASTVAGSLLPRNIQATAEAGIGVRWGRGEGERSRLAVRGYLQIGRDVYGGLVQISVRSRMTDELLTALVDHVRVCEAADKLVDRTKHPEVIGCHELALPLAVGFEKPLGRGETTTVFVLASGHPGAVDLPYLRGLWRPDHVNEMAVRDWAEVQAWAQEFSFAQSGAGEPESAAEAWDGGGGR